MNDIGYGFLSENAAFAERVEREGIIFIGPTAATINAMGSKSQAKRLLSRPPYSEKVPLIPGYNGDDQSIDNLTKQAFTIGVYQETPFVNNVIHFIDRWNVGFPLLIKASAGGGGKGMKIVRSPNELKEELESAKREAKVRSFNAFNPLLTWSIGSP